MIARHIKTHKPRHRRRRRRRTIVYREKEIFIDFRLFVCLQHTFAPFFNYPPLSFAFFLYFFDSRSRFGFLFTHTHMFTNAFIAVIADVLLCLCCAIYGRTRYAYISVCTTFITGQWTVNNTAEVKLITSDISHVFRKTISISCQGSLARSFTLFSCCHSMHTEYTCFTLIPRSIPFA